MTAECPECGQLSRKALCLCGYRFSRAELKAAADSITLPRSRGADQNKQRSLDAKATDQVRQYQQNNKKSLRKPRKTAEDYLIDIWQTLGRKPQKPTHKSGS